MEIQLTVRAEQIAVLKLFMAVRDVRYYLKGIALEIGAHESRLIATDGHRVGCFRVESEQPGVTEPLRNIIIPDTLLKAVKPKGGALQLRIGELLEEDANTREIHLTQDGLTWSGKTLDGVYPLWRSTVPAKVSGEAGAFNPAYVGDLAKAWKLLHNSDDVFNAQLGHNGGDLALIALGDDNFLGVLCPLRLGRVFVPQTPPDWWADSLRPAQDSAPAETEAAADLV